MRPPASRPLSRQFRLDFRIFRVPAKERGKKLLERRKRISGLEGFASVLIRASPRPGTLSGMFQRSVRRRLAVPHDRRLSNRLNGQGLDKGVAFSEFFLGLRGTDEFFYENLFRR